MTTGPDPMLVDELLPEFDATIDEHIVIDASPALVYGTARGMDFMQVHSPILDAAMFVRGLPQKIGERLDDRPPPPPPPEMRLADLFDDPSGPDGIPGWVALDERPGHELVFGAIGKVWQPDIDWLTVAPEEFSGFSEPDYAKLAVSFSVRYYGTERSLLSYEARTAGTDPAARRKFLRYWWVVRYFVHFVMRAAVTTVKGLAEEGSPSSR